MYLTRLPVSESLWLSLVGLGWQQGNFEPNFKLYILYFFRWYLMKINQWTITYTYLLIFIEQEPPNMSPIEKQKIMKEAQAYLNSQMYKCVKEKGYGVMLGKNLNTRWDILMATLHYIKLFTQVRFNKCYRAMYRYMYFQICLWFKNFKFKSQDVNVFSWFVNLPVIELCYH